MSNHRCRPERANVNERNDKQYGQNQLKGKIMSSSQVLAFQPVDQQAPAPAGASPKSAFLNPIFKNIPDTLKKSDRWFLWKAITKPDKTKPDKVPYDAKT